MRIHARRSVIAAQACWLSTWKVQHRQRAWKWLLRWFYHHVMTKSLHQNDIYYIEEKESWQIHGSVSSVTDVSDVSDDSDDSFTSTSLVFLSGRYQAHPRVYPPRCNPTGEGGEKTKHRWQQFCKKILGKNFGFTRKGGLFSLWWPISKKILDKILETLQNLLLFWFNVIFI